MTLQMHDDAAECRCGVAAGWMIRLNGDVAL